MNNSKSRTDIFYFIVLILTLLIMIVGVTFTYFSLIASEKEDSTKIKTGTLAINYIDGIAIDTYALMPINEFTVTLIFLFTICPALSSIFNVNITTVFSV